MPANWIAGLWSTEVGVRPCGTNGPHSVDASILLVRVTADGAIDSTFSVDGISRIDLGGSEELASIVQQSDGKLVAVGGNGGGASARRS